MSNKGLTPNDPEVAKGPGRTAARRTGGATQVM